MPRLTVDRIARLKHPGGNKRHILWDSEVVGLGCRVYPGSKRKVYVLSYRINDRKRFYTIAPAGSIKLDKARDEARDLLALVRAGTDPLEARRGHREDKSFGTLWDEFLRYGREVQKKKTADLDRRRLDRNLPRSWRSRLAVSITEHDIARMLKPIIERGANVEAARTVELLRTMFKLGALKSWKNFVPSDHPNPTGEIQKTKPRQRKRYLRANEHEVLFRSIDAESNVFLHSFFITLAITGMRKSELRRAKWADIDWEEKRLRLPDSKADEPQEIMLSGPALGILQSIPKVRGNPHIFASHRKPGKPLASVNRGWGRIRNRATIWFWAEGKDPDAANLVARLRDKLGRDPTVPECMEQAGDIELPGGLLDLTIHDLRRSFGSAMSRSGVDLRRVQEALRHKSISTTLIYSRLAVEDTGDAVENTAAAILEKAGRLGPASVVG